MKRLADWLACCQWTEMHHRWIRIGVWISLAWWLFCYCLRLHKPNSRDIDITLLIKSEEIGRNLLISSLARRNCQKIYYELWFDKIPYCYCNKWIYIFKEFFVVWFLSFPYDKHLCFFPVHSFIVFLTAVRLFAERKKELHVLGEQAHKFMRRKVCFPVLCLCIGWRSVPGEGV